MQWFINLLRFFASKSVASVTAEFTRLATDLEKVEAKARSKVSDLEADIRTLIEEQLGHHSEANDASAIADRVRALIAPATTSTPPQPADAALDAQA